MRRKTKMAIKAQTLLTRRENVGRRVICNRQAFLVDCSKAETGGKDIFDTFDSKEGRRGKNRSREIPIYL